MDSEIEIESTQLSNKIGELENRQAAHLDRRARVLKDAALSPLGKQEQIELSEAAFVSALEPARSEARARLEALSGTLSAREAALYEAARPQPTGPAEWTEAAARAQFIREDLERMASANDTTALRAALTQAKAQGDDVAAWLFLRYADRMNATEAQARFRVEAMYAEAVVFPVDSQKLAAVKGAIGRAIELERRLRVVMTPAEEREFRARYGLN